MSQLAPWRAHLAKYQKAHPSLSLKEAMKAAAKTYRKGKKQKGGKWELPVGPIPKRKPVLL